jgi:hypothetical protein
MLYQWIVYVHILAVFAFLLAHGTATAITFKLRRERKIERIRALLDLSRSMSIFGRVMTSCRAYTHVCPSVSYCSP